MSGARLLGQIIAKKKILIPDSIKMAFNRYMHPENPYIKPPDFKQLAIKYPEFKKHCTQADLFLLKRRIKKMSFKYVFHTV